MRPIPWPLLHVPQPMRCRPMQWQPPVPWLRTQWLPALQWPHRAPRRPSIDRRRDGLLPWPVPPSPEAHMILVSILYPGRTDARFDFDYYTRRHMPRAVELLSARPGYQGVTIEKGLSAAQPGDTLKFVAACSYQFSSIDDFVAAFMPVAPELQV